jgi:transcriptional regulator with XRE-family HTH domain
MPRTATSVTANSYVASVLRSAREAAGLTQSELAERLDVSPAYVQKVEAGKANLTIGQLARFGEALGAFLQLELKPLPVEEPFLERLLQ